jgi:hypothetical protein
VVAEEKRWRKSIAESLPVMEQLEPKDGKPASGFYVLCLAELDGVRQITRPECFQSRDVLLAELRRLMVEPTLPSRPVPDVRAYQAAQKWWLEFLIMQYEEGS